MKLQILVPQYNETDEIVKPLLDSLMIQQNIDFNDFGVIIVNDGSNIRLSSELLSTYPFQIDYYLAPHRGVSATRNTLLDYAIADYVMYCDADDMFFNACGLWLIFREINIGFDTLTSKFIEAGKLPDGSITYINHENDGTFVHGKVHRRQYLIDNDIRWNPNLTIHEDSFFETQCNCFTNMPKYLNESFYLWRYRPDSVCRQDPKYLLKTYSYLIDSMDSLVEKLKSANKMDKVNYYVAYILLDVYYTLNKPEWRDKKNIDYLSKVEYRAYEFFEKYKDVWLSCSQKTICDLSQGMRAKSVGEGMLLEELTINQWLNKIVTNYSDKK